MSAGGGLGARRVVLRWAWRMFRREWRQQILVLVLISVTSTATAFGVSAVYNAAASDTAAFGTATESTTLTGQRLRDLATTIADFRAHLGATEAVGHRPIPIPGAVNTLDLRFQDPHGPFGAPLLRLRSGAYPTGAAQVALTRGVASAQNAAVGSKVELDGHSYTVTGIVENPQKLNDQFALAPPQDMAAATSVTLLTAAPVAVFEAFRRGKNLQYSERGTDTRPLAALGTLGFATVAMLLVSLVAAAGFAAVAHRRLRQIGMLAAVGARDRHLRLVLVAHGAIAGALAAAVGTVAGLGLWLATASSFETHAGHRIDAWNIPWPLIALTALVTIATPALAAWWPARAIARIPTTQALSDRPPRPTAPRRSVAGGLLLLTGGVLALVFSSRDRPALIVTGIVALVAGMLLVSPGAIRAVAVLAAHTPVAPRLAMRDLGRYQGRSAAALAAISLALGIPVAVMGVSAIAQAHVGAGTLPATQLLISTGIDPGLVHDTTPDQLARMQQAVTTYSATLDHATTVPLQVAYDPGAPIESGQAGGPGGRPAVQLGARTGSNTYKGYVLYVATPATAAHFGLHLSPSDKEVLTPHTGTLYLIGTTAGIPVARTQAIPRPVYSSDPDSFLTEAAVAQHGWQTAQTGWLLQNSQPLTAAQINAARAMAIDAGLVIESRDIAGSLLPLRLGAVGAGTLLALAVLGMTVGTIRGEATADLRTLTATGASRRIRRQLTATTSGALAGTGTVLGTACAALGLLGVYHDDLGSLRQVPLGTLAAFAVGVPLLALLAGWLLSGREPDTIARRFE
ncbi:FtsX-like permease family protein [Streptacidiphilus sp. PAMC 29251]